MYIKMNIQTELEIRSLVDLPKIKSLMENLNMKINRSIPQVYLFFHSVLTRIPIIS